MNCEIIDLFPHLTDEEIWNNVPIIDLPKREQERRDRFVEWATVTVSVNNRLPDLWTLAMELAAVNAGLSVYSHRSHYFK
jgi:hypothetical protein